MLSVSQIRWDLAEESQHRLDGMFRGDRSRHYSNLEIIALLLSWWGIIFNTSIDLTWMLYWIICERKCRNAKNFGLIWQYTLERKFHSLIFFCWIPFSFFFLALTLKRVQHIYIINQYWIIYTQELQLFWNYNLYFNFLIVVKFYYLIFIIL